MPTTYEERRATAGEQELLQKRVDDLPGPLWRAKLGIGNFVVVWAASLLVFVIVWLIVAWAIGKLTGSEFGFESEYAIWIVGIAGGIIAIFSILSTVKWLMRYPDRRAAVRLDAENRSVVEENYEFQPYTRLSMIRAAETTVVFDRSFSGERLQKGDPVDLMADPDQWPEQDVLCDIAWHKLEEHFSS